MRLAKWYMIAALVLVLGQGCNGCGENGGGSSTPPPTPPTTGTPAIDISAVLDCIVGKTIRISGDYLIPLIGSLASIDREVEISADLFKVKETGGDGLAERPSDETKVETWEADFVGVTRDGSRWGGFNDETEFDCYKVEYKRGPFEGPSGEQCTLSVEVRICPEDDCHIEGGKWKLKCGVNADGTGGEDKAWGTWEVQD